MSIVDQTPRNISWGNATSVAFGVHNDVQLNVTNNGPQITSWEIEPPLPSGLSIATSGDIRELRSNAHPGKHTRFGPTTQEVHSRRHLNWQYTMWTQTGKT